MNAVSKLCCVSLPKALKATKVPEVSEVFHLLATVVANEVTLDTYPIATADIETPRAVIASSLAISLGDVRGMEHWRRESTYQGIVLASFGPLLGRWHFRRET
jgi:hypothetical protein